MPSATISKNITKGEELVVIPRKEYEEFLMLRRYIPTAKLTPSLRRDLEQAHKEYKKREYITLDQLERELGTANKKKR